MKKRMTLAVAAVLGFAVAGMTSAVAQPPGAQKTGDSPPTPRLPDGTVDLGGNGIWNLWWVTDFGRQLVGRDDVPFLPWTKAMFDYNKSNSVAYDPQGFCLPPGGPRAFGTPYPAEIIQQNDRIVVIFEGGAHVWREIHMDGRELPDPESLTPTYFGYSVGHWEGDTLVVETSHLKPYPYMTRLATSSDARVVERMRLEEREVNGRKGKFLVNELVLTDPKVYTTPIQITATLGQRDGLQLLEYTCSDALWDEYLTKRGLTLPDIDSFPDP